MSHLQISRWAHCQRQVAFLMESLVLAQFGGCNPISDSDSDSGAKVKPKTWADIVLRHLNKFLFCYSQKLLITVPYHYS